METKIEFLDLTNDNFSWIFKFHSDTLRDKLQFSMTYLWLTSKNVQYSTNMFVTASFHDDITIMLDRSSFWIARNT